MIELIAVAAIAGVLAAIILPGLQVSRERSRRQECAGRLRILANSANLYSADNHDSVFGNTPDSAPWNIECLTLTAYQAITNLAGPHGTDCPGLYPFTIPGLVTQPGGRLLKQGGVCIGYNYLGGLGSQRGASAWASPLKTSEESALPLFTDSNNYGDDIRPWSVVPHRMTGPGRIRGSTYMWLDWLMPPSEYGAEGGNVATLGGSVTWRPITKMEGYHWIAEKDYLSFGFW